MANLTITNYYPQSWLRRSELTEQHVLTGAGADVFASGTIMGRITSTGKWYPYTAGDSPTGTVNIKGILLNAVTTTAVEDYPCNILLTGEVDKALITIDGSDAGSGITVAIQDQLRAIGINVVTKTELNSLDTQD